MSAAIELAFRARLASLVVASTGAITLAATATGFTRTSGSFVSDGFVPGMEVVPSGFTDNAPGIVDSVAALTLTLRSTRKAQASGNGRSLLVGLPTLRLYENTQKAPVTTAPFVETELIGQPGELLSGPAQGGTREDRGLYVVRWYGLAGDGALAIRRGVDALLAQFTPHTTFAAGTDVVRVRGDSAPYAGAIRPTDSGHAVCVVTIPWRCYRQNVT